jgi:hypothetical protein
MTLQLEDWVRINLSFENIVVKKDLCFFATGFGLLHLAMATGLESFTGIEKKNVTRGVTKGIYSASCYKLLQVVTANFVTCYKLLQVVTALSFRANDRQLRYL